ncbi:MAG: V-type ATP synthase subunit D [Methanobacteriota archaeon]
MSNESVNPTRMELLETKGKIRLAEMGHNLLKQKRDILVIEFLSILENAKHLRGRLNSQLGKAYRSLVITQVNQSLFEIEDAALSVKKIPGISVTVKNTMGVKLPVISRVTVKKGILERGYSVVGTSAKIDDVAKNFEDALETIINIAEYETSLKKLIIEIEKNKRRVNALEHVMIPRLKARASEIVFRLDEMERESFVTMKMLKDRSLAEQVA